MAATSPRKPRRTEGRHRRPSNFEASNGVHWLRIGAVGIGVAAAIAGGQGIASATPDGSSKPSAPKPSAPKHTTRSGVGPHHASVAAGRDTSSADAPSADADNDAADGSPSPGPDRPRQRHTPATAPRIDQNTPGSKRPLASTAAGRAASEGYSG